MKSAKKLVLAVGILGSLLIVSPAFAVENAGVGGRPANPRDDNPRSKSIFVYELEGGSSVTDAVMIVNSTDQKKTVEVYATDSQIASGGAFSCEQKADTVDSDGSWIKLSTNKIELDTFSEREIPFVLNVPKDASVGEHSACIAIQSVEAATPSAVNGVQLNFRSAIRVAVTVPGDIIKGLSFTSLTAKTGHQILTVNQKLKNSGNVSLDTILNTSVVTIFGFGKQTIEGEYPIIAGQEAEFNFEYKRPFWGGFYRVEAKAQYNNDPNFSLGETSDKQENISTEKMIFVVPKPAATLVYIIVVSAIAGPILWKRRQKRKHISLKAQATPYTANKGDDINSIAKQFSMTWQTVAKLNGLKPPYPIQRGQEVLVILPPDYIPPKKSSQKSKAKTASTKVSTNRKPKTSSKNKKSSKKKA